MTMDLDLEFVFTRYRKHVSDSDDDAHDLRDGVSQSVGEIWHARSCLRIEGTG